MRLRFLLRPGWVGVILLVAAFSTVCFTVLAPWQFGRDQETKTRNAAIQRSSRAAPQPLDQVLPGGRAPDTNTEWTRVALHGHYLPEAETLGWLRTVEGEPAIEVLTPFRLDHGQTVLIDRGYLRPVNGTEPPDFPPAPTEPVTLHARVRMNESDSEHRPAFFRDGHRWSYAVNSKTVGDSTRLSMRPGYFALTDPQPGALAPLPLPTLQIGPYFSYALQWIAFGVMAPLGVAYWIYAEARPSPLPERTVGQSGQESLPERQRPTRPSQPAKRPQPGHRPQPARQSSPGQASPGQAASGASRGLFLRRRMSVAEAIAEDERREREERDNQQQAANDG